MELLPTSTIPTGFSALWQRKDGKPVVIVTAVLALLFLYWGMPALIRFATDLFHLAIMMAGGLLIFWAIVDNDIRTKAWYIYKGLIRAIFGWFVNLNPEAILKTHLEYLNSQLTKFKAQVTLLRKSRNELEAEIANIAKEKADIQAKSQFLKQKGDMLAANNMAARYPKIAEHEAQYKGYLEKVKMLISIFERVQRANELAIENTSYEIEDLIKQRRIGGIAVKAIKSSFSILFGNSADRQAYELAVNKMQDDIAMQKGMFDSFMADTKPILANMDVQDGMFQAEGQKLLEEWDAKLEMALNPALPNSLQKVVVIGNQQPTDAVYKDLLTK